MLMYVQKSYAYGVCLFRVRRVMRARMRCGRRKYLYGYTYSFFKLFKVLYNFKAATHGGPEGRVVQGNRVTTSVVEPVVPLY